MASKWDHNLKQTNRNFIKENAFRTSDFDEKVAKFIRDTYQGPFNLNLPKIEQEMHMSRREIISNFSKFMGILWYKAMQNKKAVHQDPAYYLDGIDQSMFKNGIP